MNLLTIPLRHGRRKAGKTLLLFALFTLGVISIVALRSVSERIGDNLERKLNAYGANILVSPRAEKLTVSYGGFHLGDMLFDVQYLDAATTTDRALSIPLRANISVVAPKLIVPLALNGHSVGLVGVDWEAEKQLKSYWDVEGAYPAAPGEVLLGATAARVLGLKTGDAVNLGPMRAKVSGVLSRTGSDDDNIILADIGAVQRAFDKPGKANFVEVAALCGGCPIDDIVAQLGAALPGTDVVGLRSVVEQRMFSVHFVKHLALAVSLVILLTACAMVGLSMLASVAERTREIGILRALGFSKSAVFGIFSAGAVGLGLASGLAGHTAGFFVGRYVLELLLPGEAQLAFSPPDMAATACLMGLLALAAAGLPAWKAARVEPYSALNSL